jgi:phospholipase C
VADNANDRNDGDWKYPGVTRRRFLKGLAAGAGALGVGGAAGLVEAKKRARLPKPDKSGIDHIVVVTMENRSFDHFLGWLPGADGQQAGLTYLDRTGARQSTYPLAPDFQGCGHPDPDHSYEGGRVEFNGGRCDGWLRAGANDRFAIGYYTRNDLRFFGPAAPYWTTCDRYFSAIMGPSTANRIYMQSAQTDRITQSLSPSFLPTIWDRLADAGVSGRYYSSDLPFLALWGTKYLSISRPLISFLTACATNRLPAVSFVDPRLLGAEEGLSNDDHPHADIRNGEAFLNLIYTAVTRTPVWPRTLLIIQYDEWGGFFDHVPPPVAPIPEADLAAGNTDGLRGFRVPCVVVSPFARRNYVDSTILDPTSVLRFIEWRWRLQPLTVRDATANNLAEILDFDQPSLAAPVFSVPQGPFGSFCGSPSSLTPETLLDIARSFGWSL